jgi:fused signal recognition particle receptor
VTQTPDAESRTRVWSRVAGRTREVLAEGMRGLRSPLSPEFYEGLEELLVAADLGPGLAAQLAASVQARRPTSLDEARFGLEVELSRLLSPAPRALNLEANPTCILLYGINGAGKTTSAGKLAYRLRQDGRNPLLVAADTYRAAGLEQTAVWARGGGGGIRRRPCSTPSRPPRATVMT